MVHYGQIDDKGAEILKEEIEAKLKYMVQNPPHIDFKFNPVRVIKYSDLTSIFSRELLVEYTNAATDFPEKLFEPKQCIVSPTVTGFADKLLFVVRGKVV